MCGNSIAALILSVVLTPAMGQGLPASANASRITNWLNRSNLIVAGTLRIDLWRFPWLDGWHYRGRIEATEVILGGKLGQFKLHWTEAYNARRAACGHLTSDDDGQAGIWFLSKRHDDISLSGVEVAWCNGPLAMPFRKAILDALPFRR